MEELIRSLCTTPDPMGLLFDQVRQLWVWDGQQDLNQFYEQKEKETNELEKFLTEAYFEIYQVFLEKIKHSRLLERFTDEDVLIFMDSFSLREANLLLPALEQAGYHISKYTYALSEMPSDTHSFLKKVLGISTISTTKKWKDYEVVYIAAGEVPKLLPQGQKALIWLSFPDQLLHHTRGRIITPEEAFIKTKEVLIKVLEGLSAKRAVVMSDHGYIYVKSASLFLRPHPDDERILKRIFQGKRGITMEELDDGMRRDLEKLRALAIDETFTLYDEDGCYVRGRHYWSLPGRQSDIAHGGLSLMECITPVLHVQKE